MNNFIEKPINKRALSLRVNPYGLGVNDANYLIRYTDNGKSFRCPFYFRWLNMLMRCYCDKFHKKEPTYIDCSVCDEWLTFSNFKAWMIKQDWQGKHLDKDILVQGNKIYSPETCIFVTQEINKLLNVSKKSKNNYLVGVYKKGGKYVSRCRKGKSQVYLGIHETEIKAHNAYKEYKSKLINELALNESDPLKSALMRYAV